MDTINISLPKQLKKQGKKLIKNGYYASFSDLVRASLRLTLEKSKYDLWAQEVREEDQKGEARIIKSKKDIKNMLTANRNA